MLSSWEGAGYEDREQPWPQTRMVKACGGELGLTWPPQPPFISWGRCPLPAFCSSRLWPKTPQGCLRSAVFEPFAFLGLCPAGLQGWPRHPPAPCHGERAFWGSLTQSWGQGDPELALCADIIRGSSRATRLSPQGPQAAMMWEK